MATGQVIGIEDGVQTETEETVKNIKRINNMTQYEMCALHRFARSGHPYFVSNSLEHDAFARRFKELGGMTPEISKDLGW